MTNNDALTLEPLRFTVSFFDFKVVAKPPRDLYNQPRQAIDVDITTSLSINDQIDTISIHFISPIETQADIDTWVQAAHSYIATHFADILKQTTVNFYNEAMHCIQETPQFQRYACRSFAEDVGKESMQTIKSRLGIVGNVGKKPHIDWDNQNLLTWFDGFLTEFEAVKRDFDEFSTIYAVKNKRRGYLHEQLREAWLESVAAKREAGKYKPYHVEAAEMFASYDLPSTFRAVCAFYADKRGVKPDTVRKMIRAARKRQE